MLAFSSKVKDELRIFLMGSKSDASLLLTVKEGGDTNLTIGSASIDSQLSNTSLIFDKVDLTVEEEDSAKELTVNMLVQSLAFISDSDDLRPYMLTKLRSLLEQVTQMNNDSIDIDMSKVWSSNIK